MDLNVLYDSRAEYSLQRMKGRYYEQGEEAARILAAQLRQQKAAPLMAGRLLVPKT